MYPKRQCKKKDCIYRKDIYTINICDYLSMTKRPRGCSAADCDKYIPQNGKRKKIKADILISTNQDHLTAYKEGFYDKHR